MERELRGFKEGTYIIALPRSSQARVTGYDRPSLLTTTEASNPSQAVRNILFRDYDSNVASAVCAEIRDRLGGYNQFVMGVIPGVDVKFESGKKASMRDIVKAQREMLAYDLAQKRRGFGDPRSEDIDSAYDLMAQIPQFSQFLNK